MCVYASVQIRMSSNEIRISSSWAVCICVIDIYIYAYIYIYIVGYLYMYVHGRSTHACMYTHVYICIRGGFG